MTADYQHEYLVSQNQKISIPERIGNVLSKGGISISITSTTNIIVFFIGFITSNITISSNFCLFACIGVFCGWILQLTLFPILLSYDAKRQENNMVDVCCCMHAKPAKSCYSEQTIYFEDLNYFQGLCMDYYIPKYFLSKPGILLSILFSLILIILCYIPLTNIEPSFETNDFI
eukprot:UN30718